MDPSSAAPPGDSAANTEPLDLGSLKRLTMTDAATVEFAPGLHRPPALGTPPPPRRPGDPLYRGQFGPGPRPSSAAWRVLVPVISVGLLVVAIGGGLVYAGGQAGTPVPAAAPQALPGGSDPAAGETGAQPAGDQSPPPPAASLTGPGPVAFGTGFSVAANNFACAGGHLEVTLGGHSIAAGTVDGAGNGTIVVSVEPDGTVATSPGTFVLGPGTWTIIAAVPGTSGCTASVASVQVAVQ